MAEKVTGCFACFKYLLFLFNACFWIIGLALLGLGIYAEIERRDEVAEVVNDSDESVGGLLIGVGALTALVGFAGCCGALKEHRGCLLFYSTMVTILFVLECVAGGLAYRYRDKLRTVVEDGMHDTLKKYDPETNSHIDKSWNYVQTHFKCCGVTNYSDWSANTTWSEKNRHSYPASCCGSSNTTYICNKNDAGFHDVGCYDKVYNELRNHWQVLAGVAIGVAVIQIFGIIISCGLQHHVRKSGYQYV